MIYFGSMEQVHWSFLLQFYFHIFKIIWNTFSARAYLRFILIYFRLYGTSPVRRPLIFAALVIALYTYHIYYLAFVHFDYGYNMQVNIFFGKCKSVWIFSFCDPTSKDPVLCIMFSLSYQQIICVVSMGKFFIFGGVG